MRNQTVEVGRDATFTCTVSEIHVSTITYYTCTVSEVHVPTATVATFVKSMHVLA